MDEPTKLSRLPTFQILILLALLLAVRLADDITLTYIGPYINQAWLHCSLLIIYPQTMNKLPIVVGDQRKVGIILGLPFVSFPIRLSPLAISTCMTDIRILRCQSGRCTPLEPPF